MAQTTKVAQYLFDRLRQLGVESIFGVPGDYNLRLLDYVEPAGLRWIGNCNELNAAYAADGYARIKGLSALITTFGVGELSAANGIAGAYAERAPIVHIVGTPSRQLQESRALMHHTFADGEYRRFAAMHAYITVAQTNLMDPRTAVQQIEWVLQQALLYDRPVYLEIPDDMVDIAISEMGSTPSQPYTQSSQDGIPAVECVRKNLYSAKRPLILVDGESRHCGILDQIDNLIRASEWPTFVTASGKGMVNEELQNVHGVYVGRYGSAFAKTYYESADLVLHFGPHISDTNTQGFTILPKKTATISFAKTVVDVKGQTFRDLSCESVMVQMLQSLDPSRLVQVENFPADVPEIAKTVATDPITQEGFYRFVNRLIRAGDVVLAETGTAAHGVRAFKLPKDVRMLTSATWLSIGYMLPATLGVALARHEMAKKDDSQAYSSGKPSAILFIGDGSLQMSVQEIGTMIRHKIDAIIFVINNNGYTIERVIHGKDQNHNNIGCWHHSQALRFFGDDEENAKKSTFEARTWGELSEVLDKVRDRHGVRLVEVFMGQEDCQGVLLDLLNKQKGSGL